MFHKNYLGPENFILYIFKAQLASNEFRQQLSTNGLFQEHNRIKASQIHIRQSGRSFRATQARVLSTCRRATLEGGPHCDMRWGKLMKWSAPACKAWMSFKGLVI